MKKEQKICSYTTPGKRIQLLKITKFEYNPSSPVFREYPELNKTIYKYQIRVNRKIVENTISEEVARKKIASIITNQILQQKITF